MAEDNQKLLEGITFFEQMLKSGVSQRTALEFLAAAYQQLGDEEKVKETLVKLAELLLSEKSPDAQIALECLEPYADDPSVARVFKRAEIASKIAALRNDMVLEVEERTAGDTPVVSEVKKTVAHDEIVAYTQAATASSMRMLQYLRQRSLLSSEMVDEVSEALLHRPISDVAVSLTVLNWIEDNHPELIENILFDLACYYEMPPIPVDLFDIPVELLSLLPREFVEIRTVIPFAKLGDQVLVAILNPVDASLREEVAQKIGKPCSFFLAQPHAVRETLKRYFEDEAETA